VRETGLRGCTGLFEHGHGFAEQSFLAEAGDEAVLRFELTAGRESVENGGAEFFDAVAGEGGNRVLAGLGMKAGQVRLVDRDEVAALFTGFREEGFVVGCAGRDAVDDDDGEIGVGHGLEAAVDAQLFDELGGGADARGIGQAYGDSGELGGFGDQVPRGAGEGRDDGAVLLEKAVEEAAFAGVGAAYDGEREAGADEIAVDEAAGEGTGLFEDGVDAAQDLGGGGDADVVLGEVDAGFKQRDEFEEFGLDGGEAAGDGALCLAGGYAGLVERGGVDEVADGFGLGKVDASVDEGAEGEFAGFGETRSGADGAVETVAEDDWCTVAGDFDDVFGGVGAGGGEEGDDDFVYCLAGFVQQIGEGGMPGVQLAFQGGDGLGDLAGLGTGEADNADASPALGCRNGGYGVVKVNSDSSGDCPG
jgi:hypothetical protein